MPRGEIRAARRAAWAYLALAALCLRALIPDGFMLARGEQRWPEITPCPARSPELVQLLSQLEGRHQRHEHHHRGHHQHGDGAGEAEASAAAQCPFAASLLSIVPFTPALTLPVYLREPAAVAAATGIARLASARTPPATGPPAVLC